MPNGGKTGFFVHELRRRNHYDVTDEVFIADPREVRAAVEAILQAQSSDIDLTPIQQAFDVFARLYSGELDDYLGCETWYHDAQHSLDCTLTLVRLVDGHERSVATAERLGPRRSVLAVILALFHDAGYIRCRADPQQHGAEFTTWHVKRSGDFLAGLLPDLGFAEEAEAARQMIHYTGYELALDQIRVDDPRDRRLGFMLGSADLLAQMSDRCYLEKCRDCLYPEFVLAGLAGEGQADTPFTSAEALIASTPGFIDQIWADRLDGYFESVHRHEATHFKGKTPYLHAIQAQRPRLEHAIGHAGIHDGLRRRAECVNAGPLRTLLGLDPTRAPIPTSGHPPTPDGRERIDIHGAV